MLFKLQIKLAYEGLKSGKLMIFYKHFFVHVHFLCETSDTRFKKGSVYLQLFRNILELLVLPVHRVLLKGCCDRLISRHIYILKLFGNIFILILIYVWLLILLKNEEPFWLGNGKLFCVARTNVCPVNKTGELKLQVNDIN